MRCMYRHFSLFFNLFLYLSSIENNQKEYTNFAQTYTYTYTVHKEAWQTHKVYMFLFLIRITRRVDLAMCVCIV